MKARILKVGIVKHWVFDCLGSGVGIDLTGSEPLVGGYTVDELRLIARG